jgi:hypothetical protein
MIGAVSNYGSNDRQVDDLTAGVSKKKLSGYESATADRPKATEGW